VPDHIICQTIIQELGHPIMSTSLPTDDDVEYFTDPEIIHDIFENQVDMVIDSGIGSMIGSTVIDCTTDEPVLIREGAGEWENLL
jgi:tRNA A37 threonylcarbamoyladenosine synthetase subunit TsaC/SUA5/YrdC